MVEYNKGNVKVSDSQQNKLKSAAKSHAGVNLTIKSEIFEEKNWSDELLLKTRQKTWLWTHFKPICPLV